jgi:hypothetical protein
VAHGVADNRVVHFLVLMPVDIAGSGHGEPVDFRMAVLKLFRQPP